MGVADIIIAGMIITGAIFLLYHSIWKKRGHCQGCSDEGCGSRKHR